MIVDNYELKAVHSKIREVNTYQLLINGVEITSNIPYFEFDGNFVQIDVCDECYTSGCSSGGYVEIISVEEYYLWKKPLTDGMDNFHVCQYDGAYGLKDGTIFWPKEKYHAFLKSFGLEISSHQEILNNPLTSCQAQHLWRIYASKCLAPKSFDINSFEKIEENFLTFYSDSYEDKDNLDFYKDVKSALVKAEKINIEKIPEDANKVVVIFDVIKGYSEWDFVKYKNNTLFLPIGDQFGIVFI